MLKLNRKCLKMLITFKDEIVYGSRFIISYNITVFLPLKPLAFSKRMYETESCVKQPFTVTGKVIQWNESIYINHCYSLVF